MLGLHSSLDSNAQRAIFRKYPPGIVKVVVATNIAETSITIDEITHVVDTGRVKEMRYNAETRMAHLCETWCSRASSKQRRGRAGRTKEGVCYKLFSRQLHEQVMQPYQLPEIKRVPLEDLTLQIMLNGSQVNFALKMMNFALQMMNFVLRKDECCTAGGFPEESDGPPIGYGSPRCYRQPA